MWTVEASSVPGATGQRIRVFEGATAAPLSCADAIELWRASEAFQDWFSEELSQAPYSAFYFETPPLTSAIASRPFEFVLVDSAPLANARGDSSPFREHFIKAKKRGKPVVTFSNLSGDAMLVAPCPARGASFAHLAAFLRSADVPQKRAFWAAVGTAMKKRLSRKPVWLSTAGLGVYWLHLRLDSRPKYYRYGPYKANPA